MFLLIIYQFQTLFFQNSTVDTNSTHGDADEEDPGFWFHANTTTKKPPTTRPRNRTTTAVPVFSPPPIKVEVKEESQIPLPPVVSEDPSPASSIVIKQEVRLYFT